MYSGNDCGENYHFEGSRFEQIRKKQQSVHIEMSNYFDTKV